MLQTGKRKKKSWKRMVTKVTFVGEGFTRKPPKFERFIRPMALRFKKAHVTHPELKATFCLPLIGVKKNPQSPMYTQLGVITKGTVIEVNISELGLVTQSGKVVWGTFKYNSSRLCTVCTSFTVSIVHSKIVIFNVLQVIACNNSVSHDICTCAHDTCVPRGGTTGVV